MPTIEFDDQFVLEPAAPVRERYDMVAILRRNVANLEIALKRQTDRAEAAEAELLAIREDNHSMMLEIHGLRTELAKLAQQEPVAYVKYKTTGGNVGLSWLAVPTGAFYPREGEQLYVAPVPACGAVIAHVLTNGEPVTVSVNGEPKYRILVDDLTNPKSPPTLPEDEKAFEKLAYQILALALNNGTREAFPGKLKKLLKDVAHAKQS